MKKRIISLILFTVISLLYCLCSCSDDVIEYDEEELIAEARTLIAGSVWFNEVFWGKGLEYMEGSAYDNGNYSPAEPLRDYVTINDIISAAEKIFSSGYMNTVRATVFSVQFGDTGINGYARYYQEGELEPIMVRTDYSPVLVDKNSFLYDTIAVEGADESKVVLKVSLMVTRGEVSQVIERRINFVYEDGWRIDSHTFANFNANI